MSKEENYLSDVLRYEKAFASNLYSGRGSHTFEVLEGKIPIMISAPHAVNHTRDGQIKYADKLTGGIALLIHKLTGCHVMYSCRTDNFDPNYTPNENGENPYQTYLLNYVKEKKIEVLIDLHGAQEDRDFGVEIGTAPVLSSDKEVIGVEHPSLHGREFLIDLVTYMFNYAFRGLHQPQEKKKVSVNGMFCASEQNTVTKYISENSQISCLQIEVNGIYRNQNNSDEFSRFIKGLLGIVKILGRVDWSSSQIQVFKLWPSNTHKPQDKIELDLNEESNSSIVNWQSCSICSYVGESELVKVHKQSPKEIEQIGDFIEKGGMFETTSQYVCLTNRLIEKVFGKEWTPTEDDAFSICGIPIILYETASETYNIGLPSANRIEDITFSSALYASKVPFASKYHYAVRNRYTDSLYFIDIKKADYCDNGRVMLANGEPAKKVMVPRYYRRLLGYLDEPFSMIRKEEYEALLRYSLSNVIEEFLQLIYTQSEDKIYHLQSDKLQTSYLGKALVANPVNEESKGRFNEKLSEKNRNSLKEQISNSISSAFADIYGKIIGEPYYSLKKNAPEKKESSNLVIAFLKQCGAYSQIDLLQIPKDIQKASVLNRICSWFRNIWDICLDFVVGKSEYLLETAWTTEADDKNNVARLSTNMMSLLGVGMNDKIVVSYRDSQVILRVLENKEMQDYQIGIPAPTRKELGMNGINKIVKVNRDMRHTLKRKSQIQLIAMIGTIIAVFRLVNDALIAIIVCAIFIPIVITIALNEERIKVK